MAGKRVDFNSLSQFIPLGGATALLVILVGVVLQERHQWTIDRRAQEERHNAEMAEIRERCREDMANQQTDAEQTIQYLRTRVQELTDEIEHVRREMIAVKAEARSEMAVLRAELRDLRGSR